MVNVDKMVIVIQHALNKMYWNVFDIILNTAFT